MQKLKTVHARHLQVEHDDLRQGIKNTVSINSLAEQVRLSPVRGLHAKSLHRKARALAGPLEQNCVVLIVFDVKNQQRLGIFSCHNVTVSYECRCEWCT